MIHMTGGFKLLRHVLKYHKGNNQTAYFEGELTIQRLRERTK